MLAKANEKYIRMSPVKVRKVVDLVRGRTVASALAQLEFVRRRAALPVRKAIASALANLRRKDREVQPGGVRVSKILVNEGPRLKRWRSAPMGRAYQILKRTSHIYVELDPVVLTADAKRLKSQPKVDAPPAQEVKKLKAEVKKRK